MEAKNKIAFKWLYQRISAVGLIVLLWMHVHYIIKNIVTMETATYGDFISLIANPYVKILEIAFFFCAFSHALIGLETILRDTNRFKRYRRLGTQILWISGGGLFLFLSIVILLLKN